MLFSSVFAKLQRRLARSTRFPCTRSSFIPSIQRLYSQSLAGSPTQRTRRNSFGINAFRRLFATTEGVPHPSHSGTHPSVASAKLALFFSCTYNSQISQTLCFDIHTKCPGVYPTRRSIVQNQGVTLQRIYRPGRRRSDVSTFGPADGPLPRAIIGVAACAAAKKASRE